MESWQKRPVGQDAISDPEEDCDVEHRNPRSGRRRLIHESAVDRLRERSRTLQQEFDLFEYNGE
jgi:hypothetical protein